jgi:FeS assembly protein SufD
MLITHSHPEKTTALEHYVREYQRITAQLSPILTDQRQSALTRLTQSGFPDRKHAAWKYTPLASLLEKPFAATSPNSTETQTFVLEKSTSAYRLVFVDGFFVPALSMIASVPQGVQIGSLATFLQRTPSLFSEQRINALPRDPNPFIDLNTAFLQDGAYIQIADNIQLSTPIELLFITTCDLGFIPIRNIIQLGQASQAVVVEKYLSLTEKPLCALTNVVTECALSTQSQLEHYKLIRDTLASFHLGHLCVNQQAGSQCAAYSLALKGQFIRSDVTIALQQAAARCRLQGLYLPKNKQHVSHHTVIAHQDADTHSQQLYKGVLTDKATAAFQGKIIVEPHASKSRAQQLNKNLLLSTQAEVNTQPQLEIFTDDIQCSHGASVGQLDEKALFYLQSRGLSEEQARETLIHAFLGDILQTIPLIKQPILKKELENLVVFDHETL